MNENIKLILPYLAYKQIMNYAIGCETEISGFADAEWDKEKNAIVVGRVYPLLEQEATGADVEFDDTILDAFHLQLMDQDVQQFPRLWWHSHVDMQAYFSTTDDAAMEVLKNESYGVALVVNKKKHMYAVLNIYAPIPTQLVLDIVVDDETKPSKQVLEEIAAKVKPPKVTFQQQQKQKRLGKGKRGNRGLILYKKHLVSMCEKPECEICFEYFTWQEMLELERERGGYID